MRLGLLGGSFDPIHYGHLLLAEQCREQCALDEVWFVPTGNPPHKQASDLSPSADRVAMLELATAGIPAFKVDQVELEREGTTYTVDTLQLLYNRKPSCEMFFLIGADSLDDLPNWRSVDRITELATIVAVNRGDRPLSETEARKNCPDAVAKRVEFVTMPGVDISSTDIRRRVQEGKSIRFLVPQAVSVYIDEHGLYRRTETDQP